MMREDLACPAPVRHTRTANLHLPSLSRRTPSSIPMTSGVLRFCSSCCGLRNRCQSPTLRRGGVGYMTWTPDPSQRSASIGPVAQADTGRYRRHACMGYACSAISTYCFRGTAKVRRCISEPPVRLI